MARTLIGTAFRGERTAPSISYRTVLAAVVAVAAVAGFALARGDAGSTPHIADAELAQLLRMMALLKLAIVAAAAWLVDWRLRQPVGPGVAAVYLVSAGLMAVGPGLIWNLSHVVLGAVLLHSGIALLIVLACKDEGFRTRLHRR